MKFFAYIIIALFAFSGFANDSMLYIHTARNNPKIEKNGKLFSVGAFEKAGGFNIECKEGQLVSLVLSNKTAITIVGPAKLQIEDFKQQSPIEYDKANPYESQKTNIRIKIDSGLVYFRNPVLRPSSEFIINTPNGTYDVRCQKLRISVKNDEDKLLVYSGNIRFLNNGEFEKLLQSATLNTIKRDSKTKAVKIGEISTLYLPDENMNMQFGNIDTMYSTVLFYLDKDNNLNVKRILPKSFFNDRPKYNHFAR